MQTPEWVQTKVQKEALQEKEDERTQMEPDAAIRAECRDKVGDPHYTEEQQQNETDCLESETE